MVARKNACLSQKTVKRLRSHIIKFHLNEFTTKFDKNLIQLSLPVKARVIIFLRIYIYY